MKKFFEKHDLVKISLIMIVLSLILTWIIPQGYFNGAELVSKEITRIGTFDLFTYGLLGMYYFTVLVTFLFVVGGFYQFLSKLGAYQKLTDSIAKKLKGKEILFSLIISFVIAALASIVNEYIILVAFIPFIVTICSKLNMDKISTYVTTFGALLVGILGSTISTKVVGMNVQYFGVSYTDNLLEKILLFAIAFIVYSLFNVRHIKKTLVDNKEKKTIIGFFVILVDIGLLVLLSTIKMVYFYILLGVTVVGLVAYIVYSIKFAKKTNKNKKAKKSNAKKDEDTKKVELVSSEDLFANKVKDSDKSSIIALVIVGILVILVSVLAYVPWTTVFKVEWFTKALEWVNNAKLFGVPIFSYILGTVSEFGSWDIFGIQIVMLLAIIVLSICYKVSINTIIESFAEGFKKISKVVVILLLLYVVLEFAVMYPVIPTILDKILGTKFNVFTTAASGFIASLFTTEYQYTLNLVYSYFTATYASNLNVISILLQSVFGLVSIFAPTSAMLFVGLSYMDIPYKDWIKYIWKFVLIMLVVIIAMAFIIA